MHAIMQAPPTGWQCPLCKVVHAPSKAECRCAVGPAFLPQGPSTMGPMPPPTHPPVVQVPTVFMDPPRTGGCHPVYGPESADVILLDSTKLTFWGNGAGRVQITDGGEAAGSA